MQSLLPTSSCYGLGDQAIDLDPHWALNNEILARGSPWLYDLGQVISHLGPSVQCGRWTRFVKAIPALTFNDLRIQHSLPIP